MKKVHNLSFKLHEVSMMETMADSVLIFLKNRALNSSLSEALVLGLYGNLGAGKTTFTQALARKLGVEEHITSPTFVIQKTYQTSDPIFTKLVHIDAYRLKSGKELEVLGWKQTISDPKTLICIEWPENVADAMPTHIKMQFEYIDEGKREVTLEPIFP